MKTLEKCPFCNPADEDIVAKNDLSYIRWDRYPVNKGHLLVIPFRHIPDFFLMTPDERVAMLALIAECQGVVEEHLSPDGYNIGFNVGTAAGQTVMHCHCHVIPRYVGDVEDPRGGIRGVVPWRREY